ncbi:MAG: ATP-binding protein [Bacteroidia bacterium]
MTKTLRSRYPGLRPFDEGEENHFFGRDEEIEAVCRMLDLEELVILHGPSGMGKSSMINAGILPALSNVRRWDVPYHIITIRLTNYDPEFAKSRMQEYKPGDDDGIEIVQDPVDRFVQACLGNKHGWSDDFIPLPKESFWLTTKQMLIDHEISPLRVVFVFDQFEELFTYPEGRVEEFARQLQELYHEVMPESVRRGLERKDLLEAEMEAAPVYSEKEERLMESIEERLDMKILISMRSDKLHFLERLKPYIPEMMLNSFELRSFSPDQARRAIVEPAQLEGNQYISPKFDIDDDVLDDIVVFLEDKLSHRIDPAQLQIICQHLEQKMINKHMKNRA